VTDRLDVVDMNAFSAVASIEATEQPPRLFFVALALAVSS